MRTNTNTYFPEKLGHLFITCHFGLANFSILFPFTLWSRKSKEVPSTASPVPTYFLVMKTSLSWQILTSRYVSRRICSCPNSLISHPSIRLSWWQTGWHFSRGTWPNASISHQHPYIPDGGLNAIFPFKDTPSFSSFSWNLLFSGGAGERIQGLMHAKQALSLWTLGSILTWLHFPKSPVSSHDLFSTPNWAILLWLTNLCACFSQHGRLHKSQQWDMVFMCTALDDTKCLEPNVLELTIQEMTSLLRYH